MSLAQAKSVADLSALKAMIAPKGRQVYESKALGHGVPRGAITEISGAHGCGKTEFVLKFLAEHPRLHVAWVEDQFTAYPRAFPQLGVQLSRILFAEAQDQALWTTHQMLRSGIFGIVVLATEQLEHKTLNEKQLELRRLQLASEQAHSSLILLTETPTLQGAWPIHLQLAVQRAPATIRRLK